MPIWIIWEEMTLRKFNRLRLELREMKIKVIVNGIKFKCHF